MPSNLLYNNGYSSVRGAPLDRFLESNVGSETSQNENTPNFNGVYNTDSSVSNGTASLASR